MLLKEAIISLIGNAIFIGLATAYINHRFNERLEDYRYSQLQKQKSEILAQLLAKWGKYRGGESSILKERELYDYYEELNRMSYLLVLWIKDEELLGDIMEAFDKGGEDIRPLLRNARKYVLGLEDATTPKKISAWPGQEAIERRLFPHLFNKKKM